MRVVLLFSVILCLLSPFTIAGSIQWTGAAGNGLWNFANNWLGNAVPTANDDVIINALGGATVQVSQPAVANSIKIAGGQYAQTLTLLSQLSVGAGGITVLAGGTLLEQSNDNLPLQSNGPVDFQAGSVFSFESGSIKGPGVFTIVSGATGTFNNAALKTLSGVTLVNNGTITIQATTIQLSSAALFLNNVNITVVGAVTFLRDPSDTSDNKLQNNGQFIFQGKDVDVLTLQAPASFSTPLQIEGGSVVINDQFLSDSSITIPQGTTLTVGAGSTTKQFNILTGEGILSVQGIAIATSPASVSTLEISDSGSLTLQGASSFVNAAIGGKLITSGATTITDLGLDGGTLSGTGSVSVSANLSIQSSDTNNTNNFLSCPLTLNTNGNGESSTAVYLLLGQGGQFHIAQGASYSIINTFTVGSQGGRPSIIVDGTLSITNTGGQTFSSNVDFAGNGALKINSGTIVFNGNTVTLGTITVSVSSFILFQTVALTVGTFSGAGGFNLTAAPSPVSTISTAPVTTIGIVNGNVNIGSFASSTFNLYSGTVTVPGSSSNTATTFNVYGGTLSGSAKLTTSALNLNLAFPFTLSGFVVKTTTLSVQAIGTGNIQLTAGATIVSDSSFASRSVHNNNININ